VCQSAKPGRVPGSGGKRNQNIHAKRRRAFRSIVSIIIRLGPVRKRNSRGLCVPACVGPPGDYSRRGEELLFLLKFALEFLPDAEYYL